MTDTDPREQEMTICKSELATRPILYADEIGGKQTLRDDLWAVTTQELNLVHAELEMLRNAVIELNAQQAAWSARTLPETVSEQWVLVDGIKNVPVGVWLVYLESAMMNSRIHCAHVHPNLSIISSIFSYDAPKVLAYLAQPNAPSLPTAQGADKVIEATEKCPQCGGDGWTVEAECCWNPVRDECCGNPVPRQVQCDHCSGTGTIPTVYEEPSQ